MVVGLKIHASGPSSPVRGLPWAMWPGPSHIDKNEFTHPQCPHGHVSKTDEVFAFASFEFQLNFCLSILLLPLLSRQQVAVHINNLEDAPCKEDVAGLQSYCSIGVTKQ